MLAGVAPAPRERPRLGSPFRGLCLLLLCVAGAAAAVSLLGTRTYHWQAFEVQISVEPALRGRTRLIFTPLGEVHAATHRTPVALKVGLRNISFEELRELVVKPPPRRELERDFERAARRSLNHFWACQVAIGALGGLLGPLLLRARRLRVWFLAALAGGGFVGAALLATVHAFDRRAFHNPTYTGSLRQAGTVIALARGAFVNAGALGDKLRDVATNLNTLYGRINALPGLVPDANTVRILHVSDIHNNPAAIDFVRELALRFDVAAVIDTGDLTDFGTPLETRLSSGLAGLRVPYLFVAGNHDSQATVRALRASRGVLVLDGEPITLSGLRILGAPDPSSARPGLGDVNTPPEALRAAGERLAAEAARPPGPPDIVCVHNPRQAEPLLGRAPLVLCGHMHRAYVETTEGTVVCNAGTTGGAGLRYLDRAEGVALSAAILTFTRPPRPRLVFIDQVALDGSLSQYSIRRRTFNSPAAPPPDATDEMLR